DDSANRSIATKLQSCLPRCPRLRVGSRLPWCDSRLRAHALPPNCLPRFFGAYPSLVRATPLMIVSWLMFIVVGLITYAGCVKLAARLLRYSVSWTSSFTLAVIVLVVVIVDHVLVIREPVAI